MRGQGVDVQELLEGHALFHEDDLCARSHHLFDLTVPEAEDALEHLGLLLLHRSLVARDVDQHP